MQKGNIVITVMGEDHVGIVAEVTAVLADSKANIIDISQTLIDNIFAMILIVDLSNSSRNLVELDQLLQKISQELAVKIVVQHEDLFRYMHRI